MSEDIKRVLARPVYLGGQLVEAGTELTAAQAALVRNPKAFQEEPTLADKLAAAQADYERLLAQAEKASNAGAVRTAEATTVTEDRAENGAALARASKAAQAATNKADTTK
jgi:DNA repair exonuclease SbcCD ATPase subunit